MRCSGGVIHRQLTPAETRRPDPPPAEQLKKHATSRPDYDHATIRLADHVAEQLKPRSA